MDIALRQKHDFSFDIEIDGSQLKSDKGMRTAILISIFTDRNAEPDDVIPDGSTNRRGWWADTYSNIQNDKVGSRLWLLKRSKETLETLLRAREYTEEALQWLLDDGIASRIIVETEWVSRSVMGIRVQILKVTGEPFDQIFEYSLES